MMQVTVYSCRGYEKSFLEQYNQGQFTLKFIDCPLRLSTIDQAKGSKAIVISSKDDASAEVIEALQKIGVELISTRTTGYNHIDIAKAEALGIQVARVPVYSPHAIAEHAVALILALSRHLIEADNRVKKYDFSLKGLMGFNLRDKTVGVVGTGNIGAALIQILHGFGSKILAYDLYPNEELSTKYGVQYVDFDTLIRTADIISLNVPLNDKTAYIINAYRINHMKRGVMIINTGRGKLIDTIAAIEALKSGQIGAMGLDVYENEKPYFFEDHSDEIMQDDLLARLTTFPNVLLTGHQAFLTETALNNIAETTIQNLKTYETKGVNAENFLTTMVLQT